MTRLSVWNTHTSRSALVLYDGVRLTLEPGARATVSVNDLQTVSVRAPVLIERLEAEPVSVTTGLA